MKAKLAVTIVVLLAIAGIGAYAYLHRGSPASTTITPHPSASNPSASTAQSSPPAAGAGLAPCATTDLTLTLDDTGGGTAGTTYRQAVLTNHSAHACTIGGFPGVSLVDADDQQVGKPAEHTGPSGATITLAPGQAAASAVGFPNPSNLQGGTCTETSFNLKVYPPGQTSALQVALAAQACPGFSVQALQRK